MQMDEVFKEAHNSEDHLSGKTSKKIFKFLVVALLKNSNWTQNNYLKEALLDEAYKKYGKVHEECLKSTLCFLETSSN